MSVYRIMLIEQLLSGMFLFWIKKQVELFTQKKSGMIQNQTFTQVSLVGLSQICRNGPLQYSHSKKIYVLSNVEGVFQVVSQLPELTLYWEEREGSVKLICCIYFWIQGRMIVPFTNVAPKKSLIICILI